ncbi:MAG: hypothetical protein JWR77_733 [Rhizorhabdus sp.]|nr:hypothetical protein [Rhizorhabdus sp.]
MRRVRMSLLALSANALTVAPIFAAPPQPDMSGISPICQKAYGAMRACLQKTLDAGAPASIIPPWEKQLSDTLRMWRAMKGQPGVEDSCKHIAEKPDCGD